MHHALLMHVGHRGQHLNSQDDESEDVEAEYRYVGGPPDQRVGVVGQGVVDVVSHLHTVEVIGDTCGGGT